MLDVVSEISARKVKQVAASSLKYILRDGDSSAEDTLRQVEEHFGLSREHNTSCIEANQCVQRTKAADAECYTANLPLNSGR